MFGLSKGLDYDLFVIGHDVGGIACLKEASQYSKRVAVANHTVTETSSTDNRLTGVDSGTLLKKLMHETAALGKALSDSKRFGWNVPVQHNWNALVETIQNQVDKLNEEYEKELIHENIKYYSKKTATIIDENTLKLVNENGKEKTVTASKIILAMGGRPTFPNVIGAREYCISLEQLLSTKREPGKTLVYGMTSHSLECAGFLRILGYDVTILGNKSISFQDFDKELTNKIINSLKKSGVKFLFYSKLCRVERINDSVACDILVTYKDSNGENISEEFNTVLITTENEPYTDDVGLRNLNINLNPANGYVITDITNQTNVENIYAIGYITHGRTFKTSAAVHEGKLLARRLFGVSEEICEHPLMAVPIYTPLEAACFGYTEDAAVSIYGKTNIDIFYTDFTPQHISASSIGGMRCVAKLIAHVNENHRIVGIHVIGANACEVINGYTFAMQCGLTKKLFRKISSSSLMFLLGSE